MKYRKLLAAAMSAVMVLSGCNSGTSADKPADASAFTEEVTTTTTAESTTTGATTTTSSTAAAKLETAKKYFVDCNERPFDSKAMETFEKAFYGSWKCTDTRGSDARATLTLTYKESPFTFESWYYPCGIIETDEIYALTFINGGICGCFVIKKSDPGVMYFITEYNGSDAMIDEHAYIYTDRSDYKTPAMPENGEISVFGWYWLENEYGEDYTRKFEEAHNEDYVDEDGRVWSIDGEIWLPVEKRSIINRTESSVIIVLTYRDKEETESYSRGNSDVRPTERQFALVFEKSDSGEWSVTGYEPYTVTGETAPFEVSELLISQVDEDRDPLNINTPSVDCRVVDGAVYERLWHGIEALLPEYFYNAADWFKSSNACWEQLYEASQNELSEFFTETGFDLEKARVLPRENMYRLYSRELDSSDNGVEAYRLNENWIVTVDRESIEFYIKNERYTDMRKVIDLMWAEQARFPDVSVVALTEFTAGSSGNSVDTSAQLTLTLEIVDTAENLAEIEDCLTENGAVLADCKFLTAEELRAQWLPMKTLARFTGKVEEHPFPNIRLKTFGDKTYQIYDKNGVLGRLPTLNIIDDLCGYDEVEKLDEALTNEETIGDVYKAVVPRTETFDLVQLTYIPEEGEVFYRINEDVILEILPPYQNRPRYIVWYYDKENTEIRDMMYLFRRYREVKGDYNFRIKSLEYFAEGYDPNTSPDAEGYLLRVVADKEYWDDIRRFANFHEIDENSYLLTEESLLR